jgi:hypothetical protein
MSRSNAEAEKSAASNNDAEAEKFAASKNSFSPFSFTPYLPPYSCACLPTFLMWLRKLQQILACIACATPINSLAT